MQQNPVWYFDATGSILKKKVVVDPIYMYSIAIHDPLRRVIVSLADFFTSRHTSMMISKYLFTIKTLLLKCTSPALRSRILPSCVVTDHSFALINSVLTTFSQCTLLEYLNHTYDLIFEKRGISENHIVVQICAVHYLKIIIGKVNKEKTTLEMKHFFIFCFTLLQNATSIEMFERHLMHIYNIFMQPKLTLSCIVSINMIKSELKYRDLYKKPDLAAKTFDKDMFKDFKYVDITKNTVKSIKSQSPFNNHFKKLLISYRKIVSFYIESNKNVKESNPFFEPRLMSILSGRLWSVPLWTGILLMKCLNQCRLSNNNVECYFKIIKNHWIKDKKSKLMPSEVTCLLNKKCRATYIEHYEELDEFHKDKQCKSLDFIEEKWKKVQKDRSKGVYYNCINDNTFEAGTEFKNSKEMNDLFGRFHLF